MCKYIFSKTKISMDQEKEMFIKYIYREKIFIELQKYLLSTKNI